MTFSRSICTAPGRRPVRAGAARCRHRRPRLLLRRTIDRRADRDRAHGVVLRPAEVRRVLRLVCAGEHRHHRQHAVRGECSRDLPRRPQPLLQSQHQRCRPRRPGRLDEDLYVSYRNNRNRPWGVPMPLTSINTREFNERNAALSRDGSMLFFSSNRTPSVGGLDLYVSRRTSKNKHIPDAWSAPVNLGAVVNSIGDDIGPGYFANPRGNDVLYFTSARPGGPGLLDIQASTRGADGVVRRPGAGGRAEQPEQRCTAGDPRRRSRGRPAIQPPALRRPRRRLGRDPRDAHTAVGGAGERGAGGQHDLQDRQVALSDDAETLYFASNRPGVGLDDIWTSTRVRIKK